jgi:hypothetical protein
MYHTNVTEMYVVKIKMDAEEHTQVTNVLDHILFQMNVFLCPSVNFLTSGLVLQNSVSLYGCYANEGPQCCNFSFAQSVLGT